MAYNKSVLNVILTAYVCVFIIGIISSLLLNVSITVLDTIEFDLSSLGFCSKMLLCQIGGMSSGLETISSHIMYKENMYMKPSLCRITSAAVSESVSLHILPCSKCLYCPLVP